MKKSRKLLKCGRPYPLGAAIESGNNRINFAAVLQGKAECGIILYDKRNSGEEKIPFSEENRFGNIYCGVLEDIDDSQYSYNFYEGNKVIVDPYAKRMTGNEAWGNQLHSGRRKQLVKSGFYQPDYDWESDRMPVIPFEESVLYCLHVRGFTKHSSSKVQGKGTFAGVREKIPYLKDLGITAVELMPAYEFLEVEMPEQSEQNASLEYMLEHYKDAPVSLEKEPDKERPGRINYWGYKEGYYFAPKASYGAEGFKALVKELHKNHMEMIMQFFFPPWIKGGFILEVLKYWVLEYHVDGFHLLGEKIPVHLLATEPLFGKTKLLYLDFPCGEIYQENEVPSYRNLASYNDEFMCDCRRFLKSDEDMLSKFLYHMKDNPLKEARIHYMAHSNGFTLMDLVSYDKKHNETNLEDNMDGTDYNFSWNCGAEGKTRKKSILSLRMQQIKNALTFVIMGQAVPLLYGGDEFGNSQNGNNNAYCQDNAVSWLNWNDLSRNQEIFQFTRELLRLRKEHPILRRPEELRLLDSISCGYPDLSYHGEEVWRPVLNKQNRNIGLMYCGKYAKREPGGEPDDFFYFAFNMHWIEHLFALPKLPEGLVWELITDTSGNVSKETGKKNVDSAGPRSIRIYKSKKMEKTKTGNAKNDYKKSRYQE